MHTYMHSVYVYLYMQDSYDSPEVMNSAPMRPVSSRPTRTASRASFSEEMPTNTQARRPKTTHVSRYAIKFVVLKTSVCR